MNQLVSQNEAMGGQLPALAETTDSLAVRLAQVEIDSAVSTAKKFPRSLAAVKQNVLELVMLDEQTAEECVYALPRGGKPIKGPSVRFAEIVASQFGNCHVGSRVVDVNRMDKYVEAEGVFIDLQSGMKRTARVRRRIVDKNGRLFNDDLIIVTGNAACSIAIREAILKGVPKALWREAYDMAENVIAGDVKTLAERREGAIKAFHAWGVKPEQIFAALEVEGLDDIGLDQIATLTAMYKAIKAGEQQVEDYFPAKTDAKAGIDAAKGTAAKLGAIAGQAKGGTAQENRAGEGEGKSKKAEPSKEDRQKAAEDRHAADRAEAQKQHEEDVAQRAAETTQDGEPGQPAGDGAAETEGPAQAPADAADGEDEPDVTDEQAKAAYEAGKEARRAGRKASACPQNMRAAQRLFDSWNDGWADADEEMNPKEG